MFWLTWPLLILFALGSLIFAFGYGPLASKASAFRWTPEKCETYPLDSRAYLIRVSDAGAVWVKTATELRRLENGTWNVATSVEFGGDFVLDGEEAWTADRHGIKHFDGQGWTQYSQPGALRNATSIAASHGHA